MLDIDGFTRVQFPEIPEDGTGNIAVAAYDDIALLTKRRAILVPACGIDHIFPLTDQAAVGLLNLLPATRKNFGGKINRRNFQTKGRILRR